MIDLRRCLQVTLQQDRLDTPMIRSLADSTSISEAAVVQQWQQLRLLSPMLQSLCREELGWSDCPIDLAWRLWLPLAIELVQQRQQHQRPVVQGILGGQGTGKTTLALIVSRILQHFGLSVCQVSIDDLYKSYRDRQLLQQQDSRLCWRGPPGTHDVDLGLEVLTRLRQGEAANVPRFDKSAYGGAGDRGEFEQVAAVDVILFEGWLVGVRPIDPRTFEAAPWPIVTQSDRAFARDCNARLQAYLPLWNLLDSLMVLAPVDFRFSLTWRQQAEQQLKASGKPGMSDAEIVEFVQYFWRSLHPQLLIEPLRPVADWTVDLNAAHLPVSIQRQAASSSPGLAPGG